MPTKQPCMLIEGEMVEVLYRKIKSEGKDVIQISDQFAAQAQCLKDEQGKLGRLSVIKASFVDDLAEKDVQYSIVFLSLYNGFRMNLFKWK